MARKQMTIRIVKGKAGPHLQLVGRNGEIIMAGEPLKSASTARLTAYRIRLAGAKLLLLDDRTISFSAFKKRLALPSQSAQKHVKKVVKEIMSGLESNRGAFPVIGKAWLKQAAEERRAFGKQAKR